MDLRQSGLHCGRAANVVIAQRPAAPCSFGINTPCRTIISPIALFVPSDSPHIRIPPWHPYPAPLSSPASARECSVVCISGNFQRTGIDLTLSRCSSGYAATVTLYMLLRSTCCYARQLLRSACCYARHSATLGTLLRSAFCYARVMLKILQL